MQSAAASPPGAAAAFPLRLRKSCGKARAVWGGKSCSGESHDVLHLDAATAGPAVTVRVIAPGQAQSGIIHDAARSHRGVERRSPASRRPQWPSVDPPRFSPGWFRRRAFGTLPELPAITASSGRPGLDGGQRLRELGCSVGARLVFDQTERRQIARGRCHQSETLTTYARRRGSGSSPRGRQPSGEHEQFPENEKRPEDCLVVAGQAERQVDVEVFFALLRVAACQVGQRATAPVHRNDRALHQYQRAQDGRPQKLTAGSSERNRDDATSEKEPDCCM